MLATLIVMVVPETLMNQYIIEMTATGGVMIVAIGLNILNLTKLRVANFLPAIVVVGVFIVLQRLIFV